MNALCLGGNICLGAHAPKGWPEYLWDITGHHIVNGATRRARLVDVLREVPRQPDDAWQVVVVQTGAYDARGGGTPPAEYVALMEQTVMAIAHRWPDTEIVVCSPTPIAPSCTVRGFNRSSRRWITRVVPSLESMASDMDVELVGLHELDHGLLVDGVHPSAAGSREIAALIADAIAVVCEL